MLIATTGGYSSSIHVSLGIFQRLYELLEDACHDLDIRLAGAATTEPVEARDAYMHYAAQLKDIRVGEERIAASLGVADSYQKMAVQLALQEDTEDAGTVQLIEHLLSEAQKCRIEADSIVSAPRRKLYNCMTVRHVLILSDNTFHDFISDKRFNQKPLQNLPEKMAYLCKPWRRHCSNAV